MLTGQRYLWLTGYELEGLIWVATMLVGARVEGSLGRSAAGAFSAMLVIDTGTAHWGVWAHVGAVQRPTPLPRGEAVRVVKASLVDPMGRRSHSRHSVGL